MWLASLTNGPDIIAEAPDLVQLYEALNALEIAEDAQITVMWTGSEPPEELLELI